MTETLLWYMLNSNLIIDILATEGTTYRGVHRIKARESLLKIEQKPILRETPIWNEQLVEGNI